MSKDSKNRLPFSNHQESRLQHWMGQRETPVQAVSFLKGWRTKAEPVWLKCSDGENYVVKGRQAGRQIVNDQIVARLGIALAAPVGLPKLVEVSSELIEIEPRLSHFLPGIAHGSLWIPDCFDEYELLGTGEPENRPRYARLAVLYGWVTANDRQFLFSKNPPRLVHSVDHGHFFAGEPDWTSNSLKDNLNPAIPDDFKSCCFSFDEFKIMKDALQSVTEEQILQAVASVPEEWELTMDEREILVEYLLTRQKKLVSILSTMSFG